MTATVADLRMVPIGQVRESSTNPRKHFEPIKLQELAASIRESGVLNPLLVRDTTNGKGTSYELVDGARRFRASRDAGLQEVPVLVRDLSDQQVLEIQIIANLQRDDLTALEEAQGFVTLMKDAGYDIAKIAERVGRSVKYVYDRVKLLQLIPEAQKLLETGTITPGHAILLARLSPADQERALGSDKSGNGHIGGLFVPDHGDDLDLDDARKPVSVRELQQWINDTVRFIPEAVDLPNLFPETLAALEAAKEEELKVVKITRDYRVPDEAKDSKERTYGEASWKRADGQSEPRRYGSGKTPAKPCEYSVMGVVVAGPGRGEAFKVCINKEKCSTHWAAEQKQRESRAKSNGSGTRAKAEDSYAKQQEKWERERKEAEAERARWKKALPALVEAAASKLASAPTGLGSPLAKLLLVRYTRSSVKGFTPKGKGAEDLVRTLAWQHLAENTLNEYRAASSAPEELKLLGIDAKAIVNQVAPKATAVKVVAKGKNGTKRLAGDVKRAKAKKKAAR